MLSPGSYRNRLVFTQNAKYDSILSRYLLIFNEKQKF